MVAPLDKARFSTIRGRDKEQTKIWVSGSRTEVRISSLPYRALPLIMTEHPMRSVLTLVTLSWPAPEK